MVSVFREKCRPIVWTIQHSYSLKTSQKDPPPPRFFPCKDMCVNLAEGFQAGSATVSERLLC